MNYITFSLSLVFFFSINSAFCQDDGPNVYNFHDKTELEIYESLGLDETHPNLLNPEIAAGEVKQVYGSWSDLHQKLGVFLKEKNFEWGTEDDMIKIVHKIYFNKNGEITSYFFYVMNETVDFEKTEEFSDLIKQFARENAINLQRDGAFAQCGKTKFPNGN